ncbi:Kynurenine aminotransferase [Carabus blaptoides fortunei]
MDKSKFLLPKKLKGCEINVWVEFAELDKKYKPLNLGLGAPDFCPPSILTSALEEISKIEDHTFHQYARAYGKPRLVNALSKMYSPLINRRLDPVDEIVVTCGATEALYCAALGFIDVGDEVIVIEPYFDHYDRIICMAGGTAKYIPLKPKENLFSSQDWKFDKNELKNLFNEKTKMIIINTPHNPTGKVFTKNELQFVADLCIKWDVLCISDEVYEWMVYKPCKHERIATLPGMWERTLTVGSAGKTFCATGWRIGWAYGPSYLINNLRIIHQNCVYSSCTPLQEAVACVLERQLDILATEDSYFKLLGQSFEKKRDFTAKFLTEAGMKPIIPDGGYFIFADWSSLSEKVNLETETGKYRDYCFTKWMTKNIGLQIMPLSIFYSESNKHLGENYVRLCFIKKDSNLEKGATILKNWSATMEN